MLHRFIIFCGVLFTLTGVARGQETEAEPCAGLTVSEIVFDGCEKTRCDARKVQLRLIEITDMMALPWTFDHQEKARERLLKTGHFLELDVRCERINPVDARVVVSVVPNRLVSDVTVSGVKTIFTTDLEKRLFLRTGAVFNPDQKASQERLDRQLANLTSYMRQEGFDTAGVEVEVKTVGKDLVTLQFNVTEGKVSRIEKVVVELDGPWDKEVPSKYNCPIVKKRDIVRITGLQRGDLYTGRTARAAKRLVREFLQQYGFQAPRVKIYFDSETEDVRINVKLNHCFAIHILQREEEKAHGEGYEPLNESELFRALPFRESGIFDHREALLGIEELLVYYKTRGFLFAGIQMQFVDFRSMYDAWPYPLLGGVTYRITRGQPSEIREINFEGLRAIEAEELLNLMETQR